MDNLNYKYLLFFLLLFQQALRAQDVLEGRVSDPTGAALAFVTVRVEGSGGQAVGAFTDIDGQFRLLVSPQMNQIGFRYLGYEPLVIARADWPANGQFQVQMRPETRILPEAVIHAGEHPADMLIRKVIANRDLNNPEKKPYYRCNTYNKMVVDAVPRRDIFEKIVGKRDSSNKSIQKRMLAFDEMERSAAQHGVFVMESVTERSFMRPDWVNERVVLNRVSGTDYAGLVAVSNSVQPFSFYGDYLHIVGKDFVNPISPGSPTLYDFTLEDTLFLGSDTLWVLSFHPRKGKVFTALEGTLSIHSDGYALQNVRAWPVFQSNLVIKVEQSYQQVQNDSGAAWFPHELNFELSFKKYPAPYLGLKATGRSYISKVDLDRPLYVGDFDPEQKVIIENGAFGQPDSVWQPFRAAVPLSPREMDTYAWLDSTGRKYKTSLVFHGMDYLISGLFPIAGVFNMDIRRVLKFDQFEGTRIGFGLSTAESRPLHRSKRVEWNAYLGYGLKDQHFKYGSDLLWRISRGYQSFWRLGWHSDLQEPGAPYELFQNALVGRFLYAEKVDRETTAFFSAGTRMWPGAQIRLDFRRQNVQPQYDYVYRPLDLAQSRDFVFTESTVFFRYAYNEKLNQFLGSVSGRKSQWPAIELSYTRGLRGVWGSAFQYERWLAALYQAVFIRRLGLCKWRIEYGKVDEDVPLSRLFTFNQASEGGLSLFALNNTFQVLGDTLIAANRYASLFFTQEFGPVFYQRKYSAPYLILHQNVAWGRLDRPDLHSGIPLNSAETVLYESGIRLDNLLRVNYVNFARLGLGFVVYYRWGGLRAPRWQDNITPRLSLRFEL